METDANQGSPTSSEPPRDVPLAPSPNRGLGWTPWAVVVCPLTVVVLFLLVQRSIHVNTFDFSGLRTATVDVAFRGRFDAAKANWASGIFLALVLMATIAFRGFVCVFQCTIRPSGKAVMLASAPVIMSLLILWPCLAVPAMQQAELRLVASVSSYCGWNVLLYFIAGLFAASLLLACGLACLLRDATAPTAGMADLTAARWIVRETLGIVAAWLAVGVVGIGLFHRMTSACLHPKAARIFDGVAQSSNIFAGVFYTVLIAAMFLPAEALLRDAALARAPQPSGDEGKTTHDWLTDNGFDGSVLKSLAQVVAMFAPLFASVLQGLIELP